MLQSGDVGSVVEFAADALLGQPAPEVGEQEPRGGIGRPWDRIWAIRSRVSVSSGTIRSVAIFPSGTLSQAPLRSISCTQSSSRVEQLADPQAAGPLQARRQRCELVVGVLGQLGGQTPVGR